MAISLVGTATETAQSENGPEVVIPTGTSSGDRILAFVSLAHASPEPITPEGWKRLATSWGSPDGGSQYLTVYTKRAASIDSGSSVNFPFVDSGNAKSAAVVAVYTGSEGPVEVREFSMSPYSGSNSWDIPVPDLEIAEAPVVVVNSGSYKASPDGGFTLDAVVPSGTTELDQISTDGGGSAAVAASYHEITSTGTVTGGDFSWSTDDETVGATRAASTFAVALIEGEPPLLAQPVFRRWTSTGWVPAP